MPFASVDLARRLERAECELLGAGGRAVEANRPELPVELIEIAGGLAVFTGVGSPLSKVAGLGFAEGGERLVPDDAELDRVEALFDGHGVATQVELSTLAPPEIGRKLTERGYRLTGFENVSALALDRADVPEPDRAISIEAGDAVDVEDWMDVVVTGFCTPDTQGIESHESYAREVLDPVIRDFTSAGGIVRYLASIEENRKRVPAGGGSMRLTDGVAQLCGAATLPALRRRGVQTALLCRRLRDAAAAGCDLAVVTTQPGSKSQQNMQAYGFELMYSRAVLVKEPPSAGRA